MVYVGLLLEEDSRVAYACPEVEAVARDPRDFALKRTMTTEPFDAEEFGDECSEAIKIGETARFSLRNSKMGSKK